MSNTATSQSPEAPRFYSTSLHTLTSTRSRTVYSSYNTQRAMQTPTDHEQRNSPEAIRKAYRRKLARQLRQFRSTFELSKRMPPNTNTSN
jgi:hypothetical protein